jgi:transketolase
MKSTREAFGNALVRLGEAHPEIVALDGDVATSVMTAEFGKRYADRYFQCGIAESNMIGMAAGLASAGKVPFCASFACFVTGRMETIRMSVAYNRSNVRIVGTHVGVGIGPDGHSQMGLEDVAFMRSMPNMAVIQPSTGTQTEAAVEYLVAHKGPAYLRLTRQKLPERDGARFDFGRAQVLRDGDDVAILASGATVPEALEAAALLAKEGIDATVVDVHTIQPIDETLLVQLAERCRRLVTVEDHTVVGGLGGAVCEAIAAVRPVPVLRVGVRGFGQSGDEAELYDLYGLSARKIAPAVAAFLESPAEIALSGGGA